MRSWCIFISLAVLGACSSVGDRAIARPRHIAESSGAPEVQQVVDLGDLTAIPSKGDVPTTASDGKFVVGELILVEGDDFGKLPTLTIGGRPAKSLARTKNGGILARIPAEVAAGPIAVEVSHPEGRHSKTIEVQRFLALAGPEAVFLAVAHADGKVNTAGSVDVQHTSDLCFGFDGRALYLGVGKERSLKVVSMAAKNAPRFVQSYSLGKGDFVELACRPGVTTVAALDRNQVTFFDARVATALSVSGVVALSDEAIAAALSPAGDYLAVLSGAGNTLSLVSVAQGKTVSSVEVLEGETVPLLRDLVFSPSGDEIWVLSGDSATSLVAGTRPTKISRVAVKGADLTLLGAASIERTSPNTTSASRPGFLAVSQREAIMAAAVIRSTAERATMLLTSTMETGKSTLVRVDLEGKTSMLAEQKGMLSRALVSHDQQWAYAAMQTQAGLGIVHVPADGGTAEFLPLSKSSANQVAIPFAIAP